MGWRSPSETPSVCSVCGQPTLARILAQATPAVWLYYCPESDAARCPRCRRWCPPTDRFCTECGMSLKLQEV